MKHLILILGIALIGFGACKKDKPLVVGKTFADYTIQDIKAQEGNFNSNPITFNAPNTNFKVGSILFFKTNMGNYGKVEIQNVGVKPDYKLTANVLVYDPNGTKVVEKVLNDIPSQLSYGYDFDDPLLPEVSQSNPNKTDFVWGESNSILAMFFVSGDQLAKGFLFKL
jgi:hypothetical protein